MCQMNILVKSIQQIRMLGVWIVQAMITSRKEFNEEFKNRSLQMNNMTYVKLEQQKYTVANISKVVTRLNITDFSDAHFVTVLMVKLSALSTTMVHIQQPSRINLLNGLRFQLYRPLQNNYRE